MDNKKDKRANGPKENRTIVQKGSKDKRMK